MTFIGEMAKRSPTGYKRFSRGMVLELIEEVPSSIWRTAGKLKAAWRRVSLADCFALALALETSATLVTTDHRELDPLAEAGVCPIRFLR